MRDGTLGGATLEVLFPCTTGEGIHPCLEGLRGKHFGIRRNPEHQTGRPVELLGPQHDLESAVLPGAGLLHGVVLRDPSRLRSQEQPDLDIPLFWTKRRRLEREKAAATTARDLMSSVVVVSTSPDATVAEAARGMHAAGVKRLPVIGEDGRLVGIVSRGDLLKVFNRPDEAIRREIIDDVIVGNFMMNPNRFFIHVDNGVVVLQGRVERHSLLPYVLRAVHGVEGVVRVENRLGYDVDDVDTLRRAMAFR